MTAPGDLAELVRRVQATKSPFERGKLVARAWRTVRSLSRKDRMDLASRVGLEGAEEILERLASGERDGRVSSADVLRVLDEAEKSDPRRMRELLRQARDPTARKEAALASAEAVAKEFAGPLGPARSAEPQVPAAPPEVPPAPARPPLSPIPFPLAPREPGHRIPAEACAEVGSFSRGEDQKEGLPAATEPASPASPPPPAHATAPPPSFPPGEKGPPIAADLPSSGAIPLPARLAAVPLSTRFRLLRLAIESSQRSLSFADVERVLEAFPEGWARRRALAQLLRAGIPEDLSECRELIERLESPRARSFCFAALAGRSGAGRQASLRPPTES